MIPQVSNLGWAQLGDSFGPSWAHSYIFGQWQGLPGLADLGGLGQGGMPRLRVASSSAGKPGLYTW